MGRFKLALGRTLIIASALIAYANGAYAEVMWAELVSYTKQSGNVLMKIDDAAQPGKIEFTVEALPDGGRVTGIFLNFLNGRPQILTVNSISGDSITYVAFDTKDLGGGNNVNPSPSDRPKGLFELGIALDAPGIVRFTIDNPDGWLNCFSFGPFAMRIVYGKGGSGPVVKLYGAPVLPSLKPAP